jgi:hypothetical protein
MLLNGGWIVRKGAIVTKYPHSLFVVSIFLSSFPRSLVIPAQAGIQEQIDPGHEKAMFKRTLTFENFILVPLSFLDSRLRRNDMTNKKRSYVTTLNILNAPFADLQVSLKKNTLF